MPIVPGCDDLCWVSGLLYFYKHASCDNLCREYRVLYFYLCQLRRVCQVSFFYLFQLCQAVTTCAGYVDCYISTYASCDDLCRANWGLYFYLCQLCRECWVRPSFLRRNRAITCLRSPKSYLTRAMFSSPTDCYNSMLFIRITLLTTLLEPFKRTI